MTTAPMPNVIQFPTPRDSAAPIRDELSNAIPAALHADLANALQAQQRADERAATARQELAQHEQAEPTDGWAERRRELADRVEDTRRFAERKRQAVDEANQRRRDAIVAEGMRRHAAALAEDEALRDEGRRRYREALAALNQLQDEINAEGQRRAGELRLLRAALVQLGVHPNHLAANPIERLRGLGER